MNDYHHRKCIILIDDYDHPLNVAFENNFYEDAHRFFTSILQKALQDNEENLEKALIIGVYPIAKLGFDKFNFFSMNENEFADKFGFTENEVSAISRYHNLDRQEEIKQWYGGYEAGDGILLFNPLSVNCYINKKTFESHHTDTRDSTIIKLMSLYYEQIPQLHVNNAIMGKIIMNEINYETIMLQMDYPLWTLLYYSGYLTMKGNNLLVPSKEIEIKIQNLQQKRQSSYSVDTLLNMLLRCDIQKFEEYLQNMIIETLSFYDVPNNQSENGYHLFMIGLLSQAKFRGYKIQSNKEGGLGRFDLRIDPESQVEFETSIIMEFKVLKKKTENSHKYLKDSAKEGLAQILDKKYRTGVPERSIKLVECGIAFQGKQICILSRVLTKINNNQRDRKSVV